MRNDLIALALCLGKEQYHNIMTAKAVNKNLKTPTWLLKGVLAVAKRA